MKNIIILLSALFISQGLIAQPNDEAGKITLSIVMPEKQEGLEDSHLSRLQSKISNLLTNQGFGAEGLPNGIVIFPKVNLYSEEKVDAGLQKLTIVRGELSLFIKQVDDQVIFASETKTLSGSGKSRSQALDMLFNNVKPAEWQEFLANGKQKIMRYYAERCESIIARADQLSQVKQTAQALASLLNVPVEVPCYEKVREKAIALYKRYRDERCAEDLQHAKAKLSANAYGDGLAILGQIDPASACHREAVQLVSGISAEMDEQSKREWEFLQKVWTDRVELEKHRMSCIRDVAVAYWQNRYPTYNYLVVIK